MIQSQPNQANKWVINNKEEIIAIKQIHKNMHMGKIINKIEAIVYNMAIIIIIIIIYLMICIMGLRNKKISIVLS
jgi:lipopolysaccharide/colanic/teichoic acid biosynthesis glycosyltransferase